MADKISKIKVVTFEGTKKINIDDLHYDVGNQRLAHMNQINEKNVEELLASTKEFHVKSLITDIRERGLQEALILYPQSNIVIEGNRRLCALKILSKIAEISDLSDEAINTFLEANPYFEQFENLIEPNNNVLKQFQSMMIPCVRISKGTSQEAVEAYLTSIHIAHKEPWEKYNRAKMLYNLRRHGLSFTDIATIAEISRSTATREVQTFNMLKEYRRVHPEDGKWINKFYHFWEFLGPKGTSFRQNKQNVSNFMSLVAADVYTSSKDVREFLNAVSVEEKKSFTQNDLRQFKSDESRYRPTFKSSIYTKIGQTTKILEHFSSKELELALTNNERRKFLEKLLKSCEKVLEKIETKENSRK